MGHGEAAPSADVAEGTEHDAILDALQQLFSSLNDGVTVQTQAGRLVYANDAAAQACGFEDGAALVKATGDEILSKFRILDAEGQPVEADQLPGRIALAGETSSEVLLQYEHLETGQRRWAEVKATPIFDEDGEIRYAVNILHDVTELKRIEQELLEVHDELEARVQDRTEELKRSNEDLQSFAYAVSHDLQEPLRMIRSYLQLLERRYEGELDQEAHEFIAFAVDGAERLQGMIKDLLSYSRVQTHGQPFEPVDLDALLDDTLANLKLAIDETGAKIHRPEDLGTVVADPSQIALLLQNLISNAIKFRKEGQAPEVTIETEDQPEALVLSVRDNGIGIAEKDHDRLFQVFSRLHGRETYEGTGIGLALCKRVAERHGGRIWVESQEGEGASFHVSLPKGQDEADRQA